MEEMKRYGSYYPMFRFWICKLCASNGGSKQYQNEEFKCHIEKVYVKQEKQTIIHESEFDYKSADLIKSAITANL